MSAETDRAADREALALYPFDGSDPDTILALRSAFRAGAEFAAEHSVTARCPWADCPHGERAVQAARTVTLTPIDVDHEALAAYFEGVTDEMVLRVRRNPAPKANQ